MPSTTRKQDSIAASLTESGVTVEDEGSRGRVKVVGQEGAACDRGWGREGGGGERGGACPLPSRCAAREGGAGTTDEACLQAHPAWRCRTSWPGSPQWRRRCRCNGGRQRLRRGEPSVGGRPVQGTAAALGGKRRHRRLAATSARALQASSAPEVAPARHSQVIGRLGLCSGHQQQQGQASQQQVPGASHGAREGRAGARDRENGGARALNAAGARRAAGRIGSAAAASAPGASRRLL